MKYIFSLLFAFIFSFSPVLAASFSDTDRSFYRDSIHELADQGVINGYSDGTYKPKQNVNRAEMMKIIMAALKQSGTPANCFPDVASENWYSSYVCEGKNQGIVGGYPDGTFRPEKNINFVEALEIVFKAFDIETTTTSGDWYQPFVDAAHDTKITSKYSYLPSTQVTRERMAHLVRNAQKIASGEVVLNTSNGCGKTPPSIPPTTIIFKGVTRNFLNDIPSNYNKDTPTKFIFAWHGRTNPNTQVRGYYELTKYANDYIVVYPEGLP